jgi:aminodeoxyfutalosine deaminase
MGYRKFQADYLFDGTKILSHDQVLITDSAGKIEKIVNEKEAGEDIETFVGLISPGFINAHCHLELSHLKNIIPERTGLTDFVVKVVNTRNLNAKEITAAIISAEEEMLKSGIVAVGDICNNSSTLTQKEKNRLHYYNFIEVSGWNPAVSQLRFEKCLEYYEEFQQKKQVASLVPHAPYSVSKNLWGKITPFFSGKVISIHNQETQGEDGFFLSGKGNLKDMYERMKIDNTFYIPPGKRSLETYFENFFQAASVILVHNTFTKQQDLDFIFKRKRTELKLSFCICINANLYIEGAIPPVDLFMQNNCDIVVGTDSLASNHHLNILNELKVIAEKFPAIESETMLRWATANGARALQMDHFLGTFEKGKQPGIVLIEHLEGKKFGKKSISRRIL